MNPVTIGTRLASMILDHFLMTLVMIVIAVPFSIAFIDISKLDPATTTSPQHMDRGLLYLMLIGMSVYLCKDSFGGRSIAKRIIKHQVLDRETLAPATPLQCLLRNFFIVAWPVEVLMVLINPAQRLGDRLAKTIVVPYDATRPAAPANYGQILLCLLLAFAFLYLITVPIQ